MKKGLLVWWILLQYECPPPLRHSGWYYAAFCWQSASAQRDFWRCRVVILFRNADIHQRSNLRVRTGDSSRCSARGPHRSDATCECHHGQCNCSCCHPCIWTWSSTGQDQGSADQRVARRMERHHPLVVESFHSDLHVARWELETHTWPLEKHCGIQDPTDPFEWRFSSQSFAPALVWLNPNLRMPRQQLTWSWHGSPSLSRADGKLFESQGNNFGSQIKQFDGTFLFSEALPDAGVVVFDAQQDAIRNLLAKQLKGMTHVVRVIFIGYRQSDVEKCSERLKSNSCYELLTLKLPTPNRKFLWDRLQQRKPADRWAFSVSCLELIAWGKSSNVVKGKTPELYELAGRHCQNVWFFCTFQYPHTLRGMRAKMDGKHLAQLVEDLAKGYCVECILRRKLTCWGLCFWGVRQQPDNGQPLNILTGFFFKLLYKYFPFEISASGLFRDTGICPHMILNFVQTYWVLFTGLAASVMNSCLGILGSRPKWACVRSNTKTLCCLSSFSWPCTYIFSYLERCVVIHVSVFAWYEMPKLIFCSPKQCLVRCLYSMYMQIRSFSALCTVP